MPLSIERNDITKVNTEAIVNTAHEKCLVGEGCDMTIYTAAGHDELLAYRKEYIGDKKPGEVFITPGFNLAAKHIIHAVSPLFTDGTQGEENLLRACYRNALDIAFSNKIKSIAFPLIGTGNLGYPKADAFAVAREEIDKFLKNHDMKVVIAVYDADSTSVAQKLYPGLTEYIDSKFVDETKRRTKMFTRLHPAAGRAFEPRDGARFGEPLMELMAKPSCEDNLDYLETLDEYSELEESPALKERMRHLEDSFGEYVLYLAESKNMSPIEVQNRAWITKSVYSKMKTSKEDYQPSKRIALQFCIGLMLNKDESIDLLGRAGYAFSPALKQDLVFLFFIEHECYDILGISDALEMFGQPPIVA